jgi:hypothetical protein
MNSEGSGKACQTSCGCLRNDPSNKVGTAQEEQL